MIQDYELVEGDTCDFNDYASIDLDVALSYIDEKVQSILGHFQKDFEGEVTAENLGAKFGGYGSFLPVHHRPSIRLQQKKSPQGVQNIQPRNSPSPNCPEDSLPMLVSNSDAPPTQRNRLCSSPGMPTTKTLENSFEDSSRKQKAMSSDKAAASFPRKVELHSNNIGNDQKTLKVRIKVGPDRAAIYNAEICNLGLTFSSSSEGDSHDESDEIESHHVLDHDLANTLRIMTAFPVADDALLSPLCENLLTLIREKDDAVGNVCVPEPPEDVQVKYRSATEESVGGREASGYLVEDISSEHSHRSNSKYERTDSRICSAEKVRKHLEKISQNNVSLDHRQSGRSQGNRNHASFKDKSDNLDGEGVKLDMDDPNLEVGRNGISGGLNGVEMSNSVNKFPLESGNIPKGSQNREEYASRFNSLKGGDSTRPPKKSDGKKDDWRHHLHKKDGVHTSLEHMDNPKQFSDMPLSDKQKTYSHGDSNAQRASADTLKDRSRKGKNLEKLIPDTHVGGPLPAVSETPLSDKQKIYGHGVATAQRASADTLKERSRKGKNLEKLIPDIHIGDPLPAVHTKGGTVGGLEPASANLILIAEEWVCCDHCQKWRLLPYGTKPDHLPDKWVCDMLDWLPGMNHCDISEDETTKAVHASYQAPATENQHVSQTHTGGAMTGVISAGSNCIQKKYHNSVCDQIKKRKLKAKLSTVSMKYPVPSNGKKHFKQLAVKSSKLKEVEHSFSGVNTISTSDTCLPNKSTIVMKSNKRKGEHLIEDDANPRKKLPKKFSQPVEANRKRNKCEDIHTVDNLQTIPQAASNFRVLVKKQGQMHDLPNDMKTCSREESKKKIKYKDYADGQHQEKTCPNNGSNLKQNKASIVEDKKSRVVRKELEFQRNQGDAISERKSAEPRVQSFGSKESSGKNSHKVEHAIKPRPKVRLTSADIRELRKDLCWEQSVAATSSSSKVSDSCKNKIRYMEVRESPQDSVSSSPMRKPFPNQVSPMKMEIAMETEPRHNDVLIGSVKKFQDVEENFELGRVRKGSTLGVTNNLGSKVFDSSRKLKVETDVDDNHLASKHEVSSKKRHSSDKSGIIKSVKTETSTATKDLGKISDDRAENESSQREHVKNEKKSSYPRSTGITVQERNEDVLRSSTDRISTKAPNRNLNIDLHQRDNSRRISGSLLKSSKDSRHDNGSIVAGDSSKALKDAAISHLPNQINDFLKNENEGHVAEEASLKHNSVLVVTGCASLKEAEHILKEAEELRIHADLVKNSGFSSESNYEYFKAALKFLHGASLLEACTGESGKGLEMRPMQMYGVAAKLCKTCALEYGKDHEMATSALAYKCAEVAYLRVVYCKNLSTSQVWHDLKSSLQMVPKGESPSSSASDVDSLNNLAPVAGKATLSKGSGSHVGNHVLLSHNRLNFIQLLDFTKGVNSAMDAAKKSMDTFSSACVELQRSRNKEAIVAVKRVIDFSFQNVEEFIRLVWLALNTIMGE